MSKIAILILVHKNKNQVNRLIKHLSKDFDIYVHIDKRYSMNINEQDNVFVYKIYKTYWGSFNQIMGTLLLLSEAHNKKYERYILISGQDLPLKTNEEINIFFNNNNFEYIEIDKIPRKDGWPDMNRLAHYHQNCKYRGNEDKYKIFYRIQRKILNIISKYKPRKLEYDFYGGANWINLTKECVERIFEYLKSDTKYINRYKWTRCTDEIFFQTIIHQINDLNIKNDSLRYIDGESGPEYPRTLRINDYEKIMSTENLFARKFDETVDMEIINKIYAAVGENV
jgi:hypothetical protein